MNIKRQLFSLTMVSAVLAISACGVTEQDAGVGSSTETLSGLALDGYVARAVVYIDINENNKLDAWEKRAITDAKGYFSYNPIDAVDYCKLEKTDSKFVHCLKAPPGVSEVLIRMTKGYDLTLSEPFTGTLSMRLSVSSGVVEQPTIASPLTGILAGMTIAEQTALLNTEGLTTELVAQDFLDFTNTLSDEDRLKVLNVSLKVHKVADVIAGLIDKEFDQDPADSDNGFFNIEKGVPVDGSSYVYQAMGKFYTRDIPISQMLTTNATLETIIGEAWDNVEALAITEGYTVASGKSTKVPTIATNAKKIAEIAETLFTPAIIADDSSTTTSENVDDVSSRIRALSIAATLMRDNLTDAADRAIAAANDTTTMSSNGKTYLQNIQSTKTDVAGLIRHFTDSTTFNIEKSVFDTRQGFGDLLGSAAGTGLTVTNTEGLSGNELAIGEGDGDSVGVTFAGDTPDATSGTMKINASFLEGDFASDTDNDGDGKNDVELEGTWEQIDEYTMLMNVEVAGVVQPVIVKPTQDENGDTQYYFDMGGEQQLWQP